MTDTTIAAEQAHLAAETEASREVTAQAAPDNPNPEAPPTAVSPLPDPPPQGTPARSRDGDPAAGEGTERAEAKPLERITASDRSRADIAARFKGKRAAQGGQVEFHGDMRDPSQTYGPLGLQTTPAFAGAGYDGGQRTEELPHPAQQQPTTEEAQTVQSALPSSDLRPPSSESRLVKVKVHGREMFLPENEVIAEAQKSLAAGNLLESAKEVLAGARGQMSDVGDQTSDQQPTSDGARPREGGGHLSSESDPYVALAQTLQMESADAAGTKLKQTIESETAKARQEAAREAARQVRLENELAVSQRTLAAFEKAHPDLASDEFARDAVTTQVQREINTDLQAAVKEGILKELPKTQDERNGLHTQLRAFGAPVRSIGDIFAAAGTKYATWRGGAAPLQKSEIRSQKPENPSSDLRLPTSAQAAPRVELTTARQERRAQIVTQPTNGTVPPRPAPPPEQTTAGRRSAAIMAMRKARGQIVA
jgi:hypothetical protein